MVAVGEARTHAYVQQSNEKKWGLKLANLIADVMWWVVMRGVGRMEVRV